MHMGQLALKFHYPVYFVESQVFDAHGHRHFLFHNVVSHDSVQLSSSSMRHFGEARKTQIHHLGLLQPTTFRVLDTTWDSTPVSPLWRLSRYRWFLTCRKHKGHVATSVEFQVGINTPMGCAKSHTWCRIWIGVSGFGWYQIKLNQFECEVGRLNPKPFGKKRAAFRSYCITIK